MALSLIEELPKIVKEGRAEAERILERINSGNALALQTNELVLPSKDISGLYRGQLPQMEEESEWKNRLIYESNAPESNAPENESPLLTKKKNNSTCKKQKAFFSFV